MHQSNYVRKLLDRFNMSEAKPTNVPIQPYNDLVKAESPKENLPYRALVGSLLFLANCTRPDIAFAVSKLSRFLDCHDNNHFKAGKGILGYLKEPRTTESLTKTQETTLSRPIPTPILQETKSTESPQQGRF